jgi:hypothetical protein
VTATLGDGTNTVTLSGGRTSTAADSIVITGGAGVDTVIIDDNTNLTLGTITLTNVEAIQLAGTNDTGNAVFQAADMSGATFTMKSDGGNDGDGFTVAAAATTTEIDLSTLTIDRTIDKALSTVAIVASSANQGVTITGTAVVDTVTGSNFADTIVTGKGQDTITAGTGNDHITLTEATADQVTDTVIVGTQVAAADGVDTIVGFKVGTDDISFLNTDTEAAGGAGNADIGGVATAVVAGAVNYDASGVDISAGNNEVIEITASLTANGDLDLGLDGSELLKALSSTSTAAAGIQLSDDGAAFIIAYQSGNAYIYHADGDGDVLADASEIALVGILEGITAGTIGTGDILLHA